MGQKCDGCSGAGVGTAHEGIKDVVGTSIKPRPSAVSPFSMQVGCSRIQVGEILPRPIASCGFVLTTADE
jgi:hypothetical protein